jgi:hypothetical protein
MTKSIVTFSRRFQVWSYLVGHSQLLLRSVKDANNQTQVDVLFKNVGFILLPTLFDGLTITESSKDELKTLELDLSLFDGDSRNVFKLQGTNWHGVITAGHVAWSEDDSEYHLDSKLIS